MFKFHAAAAITFFAFSTPALAVPLNPGGLVFTTGTTVFASPELGGLVQQDNLLDAVFISSALPFVNASYNIQNRVQESNTLGTLIFGPRIRDPINIGIAPIFEIIAFTVSGYNGFEVDVNYRLDGSGDKGPTSVSRSADGDLLTFRYGDSLLNDQLGGGIRDESYFPAILTDATAFTNTGVLTLFGRDTADDPNDPATLQSVTITGLAAPSVAAVSLPAEGLLFVFGLGLLGLAIKQGQNRSDGLTDKRKLISQPGSMGVKTLLRPCWQRRCAWPQYKP